jgi:hypothetical protein
LFYLDDRIINNSVKCLLINGTNINMTYISTELNQKKFNLSTTDWHILNFTYFYELNHGYNSTFVYCRDHVEPYSPSAHWPVLNNSLLYPHHFYWPLVVERLNFFWFSSVEIYVILILVPLIRRHFTLLLIILSSK